MNRHIILAGVCAGCLAVGSVASAQEAVTRIEQQSDGSVRVALPGGQVEVLEASVVSSLNQGLSTLNGTFGPVSQASGGPTGQETGATPAGGDDGVASAGETGTGDADGVEAVVEYGTSQPEFSVALGNELTYNAAVAATTEPTAGGPTGPLSGTGAGAQSPATPIGGLSELISDSVADLEPSPAASPTRAVPSN